MGHKKTRTPFPSFLLDPNLPKKTKDFPRKFPDDSNDPQGENPEVLHKSKDGWVSYISRGMKAREPRSGKPKRNKYKAINDEELFQPLGQVFFGWLLLSTGREDIDIVDKPVI